MGHIKDAFGIVLLIKGTTNIKKLLLSCLSRDMHILWLFFMHRCIHGIQEQKYLINAPSNFERGILHVIPSTFFVTEPYH